MTGRITAILAAAALAAAFAGCGANGDSGAAGPTGVAAIDAANKVDPKTFPQADGRKTFNDIRQEAAATASSDSALLPAANDFVAGRVNRMPFGLFDLDHKPLWGPTVIYIAARPGAPAQGPFAVAAHALNVPARFRSKTSASDYDTIGSGFYTAIFNAGKNIREVSLMTLTRTGGTVRSALGGITLVADDPAPAPGERAPAIKTDTLADAHGDVSKIDTRVPPSGMHAISLDAALKKHKPIVLVFATPALCSSRVCGPVVDVAEQVKAKVGDAAIFIHQEIYNRNDPSKGYRKPVRQYGLTSEPFTFVIGADGRVVTQLQGPFVAEELETAIKAAARR